MENLRNWETKSCRICDEIKPLAQFSKSNRYPDGHLSACKACLRQKRLDAPKISVAEKACHRCGITKPANDFAKNRSAADGLRNDCKACAYPIYDAYRKSETGKTKIKISWKRRYWHDPVSARERAVASSRKLPRGLYQKLFDEQQGRCAICRRTANPGKTRFAIDHCHRTQKIRGLLCLFCNQGLGQFLDSPELLRRGADYLERTSPLTKAACP